MCVSGGSRGSDSKRNGVKSTWDRRMENGVSSETTDFRQTLGDLFETVFHSVTHCVQYTVANCRVYMYISYSMSCWTGLCLTISSPCSWYAGVSFRLLNL